MSNPKPPLTRERRITLQQARSHFASNPTSRTVAKWCRDGFKIGGKKVKLESLREGRTRVTTEESVARFLERTNK